MIETQSGLLLLNIVEAYELYLLDQEYNQVEYGIFGELGIEVDREIKKKSEPIEVELPYGLAFLVDFSKIELISKGQIFNLGIGSYFYNEAGELTLHPVLRRRSTIFFAKQSRIEIELDEETSVLCIYCYPYIDSNTWLSNINRVVFYIPYLSGSKDYDKDEARIYFDSANSAMVGENTYYDELKGLLRVRLIK